MGISLTLMYWKILKLWKWLYYQFDPSKSITTKIPISFFKKVKIKKVKSITCHLRAQNISNAQNCSEQNKQCLNYWHMWYWVRIQKYGNKSG